MNATISTHLRAPMSVRLLDVYSHLLDTFGPQEWWPGESPFEVMVGAVLVQNTAWKNVEKAIANLRDDCLLTPRALAAVPQAELEELVRPAGYYRIKAGRLRNLLEWVLAEYDGSIEAMRQVDRHELREQLLSVKGVGPETADSILLYALEKPVFVVDTYTHRVLARHGWIDYEADYHQIQDHFQSNLDEDVGLFNEFHALLVRVGHLHCRKTARCGECPLRELLPENGLVEPDWA